MGKTGLNIAVVGKDVSQTNAYLLVDKALRLAANSSHIEINIIYLDSHAVNKNNVSELLNKMDGVLVPGGFNADGTEGMILAISYARENKISFFGICLGMQLTVVEYARNVANISLATSSEFDPNSSYKIIDRLPNLKEGQLREGTFLCTLKEDSLMAKCYEALTINEAFRHGYNFNNEYRGLLENKGLVLSATSNNGQFIEAVELNNHPFFLGVQFHPEQTDEEKAHPLFLGFIEAAFKNRKE